MHSIKLFLSLGSFAAVSLAQNFSNAACSSSWAALEAAAPQPATEIRAILPDTVSILEDPAGYASSLCEAAAELPASELSEFADWGQSLLSFASVEISSYDALVTCFATGAAAVSSARSYINSIASQTAPLCEATTTSTALTTSTRGSGSCGGRATITAAPAARRARIRPY
ncbi:hypothetical protein F4678DRAFT_485504 [Xylaria arbuscula]|nr:hypothetical protein F4678DRAFT_485504 [Xylaria arbuscula]